MGILKKGSDDIGLGVSYTIYIIYLSLGTQTADPISSEPFSRIPQYSCIFLKRLSILVIVDLFI